MNAFFAAIIRNYEEIKRTLKMFNKKQNKQTNRAVWIKFRVLRNHKTLGFCISLA